MKRKLLLVVLVLAVVTASVAAYYRNDGTGGGPEFVTAAAARGAVVEAIEATGTVETVETVEVGTQVSGTITSLHADFNSRVTGGQIVARLEPSLFEAQVEQGRASLVRLESERDRAAVTVEDATLKLNRARELWAQQLIPRTDLETAEANAKLAQASLTSAEAQVAQGRASLNQNVVNLSHTVIRAPITGVVISRNVDVGQTVAASMSAPTLFVIAKDLAHMRVNARVDESDIGRVGPGQPVIFRVDAYPRRSFAGTVSQVRLQPVVESNVVSYVTIIDAPNPDLVLKPGMTANVTIEIAREESALLVPSSALRFRPSAGDTSVPGQPARGDEDGARVWVLDEGRIQPVRVTPGLTDGAVTAILDGDLTDSARVVTGVSAQATAASTALASPLVPSRPRAGGQTSGAWQGGGR